MDKDRMNSWLHVFDSVKHVKGDVNVDNLYTLGNFSLLAVATEARLTAESVRRDPRASGAAKGVETACLKELQYRNFRYRWSTRENAYAQVPFGGPDGRLSRDQIDAVAEAVGNLKSRLAEAASEFLAEVEDINSEAVEDLRAKVADLGSDEWGKAWIEPALDEIGYYEF